MYVAPTKKDNSHVLYSCNVAWLLPLNLQRERKPIKMAEPIAGDTPCQCTRPELSEFSRLLKHSGYSTASKCEILSWLAVRIL